MEPTLDTWIYATASVLFISAAPALILVILPIDHKAENQLHLKKLLAVAAGCLLGDAFLHLIPHSRSDEHDENLHHHHHDHHDHHDHEHEHAHDMSGLKILCGMMVFLIMEKFIYAIKRDSTGQDHGHDHSHTSVSKKKKDDNFKVGGKKTGGGSHKGGIHVTGWLNLAADFLHNFTDGLAIGASFLAGERIGIGTSVAIFLHEVPHEISDYAILVQSGCTKRKAIYLQLLTAIGACAGTMLSLYLGTLGDAKSWILPFTAGGFIYIATVHILPQLKSASFKQTLSELICIVGGVGLMYIMASFE
ncbi:Zinc transporter zipt-7.2, partial [Fragariocoptes setiger]